MRIDTLRLQNFKGFKDREFLLHPEFNLLIGENATGKTSILDGLAVAAGSWFLGISGHDSRQIRPEDVRVERTPVPPKIWSGSNAEPREQFPVVIEARGHVGGEAITWKRSLKRPGGRTTRNGAGAIRRLAEEHSQRVMTGEPVILPVISYYGSGRLWLEPREVKPLGANVAPQEIPEDGEDDSIFARRLTGYRYSVDDRCSPRDLLRWMRHQRRIEVDEDTRSVPYQTVIAALKRCLRATTISYSLRYHVLMADLPQSGIVPFSQMSDGYRSMLAMIGDLAYKCSVLNPHLEERALDETPGIVLVDELDLYLHPNWQRRVIEDLRTTFPKIQFICTTHSPFLIQSLRSSEELRMLEGQPPAQVFNKALDDIAIAVMQVSETARSARYVAMQQAATEYLTLLQNPQIAADDPDRIARLRALINPYADNPAFQAFLEMNRVARLGQ